MNEFCLKGLREYKDTDRISACFLNDQLTYKELWKRSEAIAWYLKENSDLDLPVAIYGDKENDMLSYIFGAIKASKTYVVLPSIYPIERLKVMEQSCNPDVLLNASDNTYETDIKYIDSKKLDNLLNKYKDYQEYPVSFDLNKTALIVYTSGSTGEPKGVEVTYQNLEAEAICSHDCTASVVKDGEPYKSCMFVSYGFIFAADFIYSIVGHFGGTIYTTPSSMVTNPLALVDFVKKNQLNTIAATPSLVKRLLDVPSFNEKEIPSMRKIGFAGEALNKELVIKAKTAFPNAMILNALGTSESSGTGSFCIVDEKAIKQCDSIFPIGRYDEFYNKFYYLEDENGDIINEENVLGEMTFVGDGVTKGYYKNEELNKTLYSVNKEGRRTFKSGDLGIIKDNCIYFAGRKDNMVKVGGNRIELEDVDAHLNMCSIVERNVTVLNAKDKYLVSYIKLKDDCELKNLQAFTQIKKEMAELVEPYKIPQKILFVEEIKNNANGKIDRTYYKELANKED